MGAGFETDLLAGIWRLAAIPRPPAAGLYMHPIFPSDCAWRFIAPDGEVMTGAHRNFWLKLPIGATDLRRPGRDGPFTWSGQLQIIDLQDDRHAADLQRVFEALRLALRLPECLGPF